MPQNTATFNENVFNTLVDNHASDGNLAKTAVITRNGSRIFNDNLFNENRKIMIVGMRVGQVNNIVEYLDANYEDLIYDREDLVADDSEKGVSYPQNGYIPPGKVSTDAGDTQNVRLLVPFTFSKDSLYGYTKTSDRIDPERSAGRDINQVHEIGIYAQVFQRVAPWQAWIDYKAGDIVMYTAMTKVFDEEGEETGKESPRTTYYKAVHAHLSEDGLNPSLEGNILWMPYGYTEDPLTGENIAGSQWVPVLEEDDEERDPIFLLYYVAKYEYPLCVEFGQSISYLLAIDFLEGKQLNAFYVNTEDALDVSEIQLAYLSTLSIAHRYARDVYRENQALLGSRGQWVAGTQYYVNDVVVAKDDNEVNTLWKCKIAHKAVTTPSPSSNWEIVEVYGNRSRQELKDVYYSPGKPDHTFTFLY